MYDIYQGSLREMRDGGGELFLSDLDDEQVEEFCRENQINAADLANGDYIDGFWLEEAM